MCAKKYFLGVRNDGNIVYSKECENLKRVLGKIMLDGTIYFHLMRS